MNKAKVETAEALMLSIMTDLSGVVKMEEPDLSVEDAEDDATVAARLGLPNGGASDLAIMKPVGVKGQMLRLNHVHRYIARLLLAGQTPKQVAEIIDYQEAHVRTIMRSGLFRVYYAQLEAAQSDEALSIAKRIKLLAHDALDEIELQLASEDTATKTKLDISWDILDRVAGAGHVGSTGGSGTAAGSGNTTNIYLNEGQINLLGTAMKEQKEFELKQKTSGLEVSIGNNRPENGAERVVELRADGEGGYSTDGADQQ